MHQMLVDVALTIFNISAAPKLPIFDNFELVSRNKEIEEAKAAIALER